MLQIVQKSKGFITELLTKLRKPVHHALDDFAGDFTTANVYPLSDNQETFVKREKDFDSKIILIRRLLEDCAC